MGYDLQNEKGNTFRWNVWGYTPVLSLAEAYGWKPKGTVLRNWESGEIDTKWDGKYFTNDGQVVIAEDASEIAKALLKAMEDIPDKEASKDTPEAVSLTRPLLEEDLKEVVRRMNQMNETMLSNDNLKEEFSGKDKKQYVKDFIDFLGEGSYVTY